MAAPRTLRLLAFLIFGLAPAHAASVHIVQTSGGLDLYNVVAAAADGDTIVVRSSAWFVGPVVAGKGLTIVAEGPAIPRLTGIRVRDTLSGQRVVIAGFDLQWNGGQEAIVFENCQGSVRLQDLDFPQAQGSVAVVPGARVTNCVDVAFVRCALQGINEAGLSCTTQSSVALYDCVLLGGRGRHAAPQPPPVYYPIGASEGWPGVRIDATSRLYASATVFEGGVGGNGYNHSHHNFTCFPPMPGANGGPAVWNALASSVTLQDCVQQPGAGGTGVAGGQCGVPFSTVVWPPAPPGSTGPTSTNALSIAPGTRVVLQSPNVARAGSPVPISLTAPPNSTAYLAVSTQAQWLTGPFPSGTLVTGPLLRRLALGSVDPVGNLLTTLSFPELAGLTSSLTLYVQAVVVEPNATLRFGTGQALCMISASL